MGLTTNVQLYLLVIYYAHPEATTYFLSEDKFWVKATTMRHPVSIDLTDKCARPVCSPILNGDASIANLTFVQKNEMLIENRTH